MNRYAQALGVMEFTVDGLDFNIRPKKGDNLRLLDIQNKAGKDTARLMKDFVPFMTELIVREEDLAKEDRADLEVFVEANVMEFFKEIMIGFRWTTREAMEQAEQKQLESFQAAAMNGN